ncbi:PREDICTED: uncharacterized protein LOC105972312 isoform X2 [Erythranthe guttata]|uniref:uncharacterized protein LOC105972312 isoform X2 n=1 Tax=Erythranthe guttata TaxID=4155 RepID=UPI00064DE371|nr:PREDICTED: uncharacterized protein LOC105972312 isoform X2 [Erythranthe guttata]|eukprot:XP_012852705.1 PREDICTED: uncharacterized protein LOC105972312 isoform X2 [Erythranthe guttata]
MRQNPGGGGLRGGGCGAWRVFRGGGILERMAAPANLDAIWREIEDELLVSGMNLRSLCSSSSIDELIAHLVRVERVLTRVWQEPPTFITNALLPAKTALVKDELVNHPHENIQFIVASCLNQVTRITAPVQPYPDNQMKDVFRLFIVALRQLPCGTGDNFSRAVQILGAMAKMKTVLIMMDLDIDQLIVDMFQFFFDSIRPSHPVTIFKNMLAIMTLVIEESGEVSFELLKPLLVSVRMDNKNTAYVPWELGKCVIEKCSMKLQPYIREAVKKMNVEVNDYAEIVVSLCQDTSNKNMMAEEITTAAALLSDGVVDPTPHVNDGNRNENATDKENSTELKSNELGSENDPAEIVHQHRRGRKPNSLMKPEEGYEHIWTIGESKSRKALSRDGDNKRKRKTKLRSDSSSHGEFDSVDEGSFGKREILQSETKERGSKRTKKKSEGVIAGSSTVQKREGTVSVGKDKSSSLQESDRWKEIRDAIISRNPELIDLADRMVASPDRDESPENLALEEEEMSNADYGEEIVNVRIKVWWPMDKTFYTGTVESFDPSTKKHKIRYDDDEEEVVDLKEERWELFNERQFHQTQSIQNQEVDIPSPVKETVMNEKKMTKRKAGSSRKQLNPSSSKISKSESCSPVHVKNEPDEEMPEFSFKHGKNRSSKKKSKTMKKKSGL